MTELLSLDDQRSIHRHSSGHRKDIEQSSLCGCFYCTQTFPPSAIEEWVDDDQTALCPRCGIDSVLGNARLAFAADKDILRQMHRFWFENDATGLRNA
jgi:hypothetical protein